MTGLLGAAVRLPPTALALYVATLGFASIIVVVLCRTLYNVFMHPLRRYPGPKLWAATRMFYTRHLLSGKAHKKILELHEKYGPVVRISPDTLVFSHPDAWNDIMGHRKRGQPENGKDMLFWQGRDGSIISAGRDDHTNIRRALAHGFSAQAMAEQQPMIQGYVTLLIDRLKEACAGGKVSQDMTAWYNWTTFDVIGDLAFGESFGCLEAAQYHPWVALIFDRIDTGAVLSEARRFPFGRFLAKLLISPKQARHYHEHEALTKSKVNKRLENDTHRPDFIEAMTHTREGLPKLSLNQIELTSSTLIIAGSETTATTLSGITYLLCMEPNVMVKLANEVRTSFSNEDEIDLLSVQKLEYMMAVINETFRIYPAVPNASPRVTPPEGGTVLGEYIPPNTGLSIFQWALYHSVENFKDPESFVPERWLGDPAYKDDRTSIFQPFSYGPRNCIGKNLAYAEMRLILARMVWNFDFKLDPRSAGWIQGSESFLLWKKPQLFVRLIPRNFGSQSEK